MFVESLIFLTSAALFMNNEDYIKKAQPEWLRFFIFGFIFSILNRDFQVMHQ